MGRVGGVGAKARLPLAWCRDSVEPESITCLQTPPPCSLALGYVKVESQPEGALPDLTHRPTPLQTSTDECKNVKRSVSLIKR